MSKIVWVGIIISEYDSTMFFLLERKENTTEGRTERLCASAPCLADYTSVFV